MYPQIQCCRLGGYSFIFSFTILFYSRSVDELDSESYSAPWTPTASSTDVPLDGNAEAKESQEQKRTYSREEFLHEAAATGGPNVGMRIRFVLAWKLNVKTGHYSDSMICCVLRCILLFYSQTRYIQNASGIVQKRLGVYFWFNKQGTQSFIVEILRTDFF